MKLNKFVKLSNVDVVEDFHMIYYIKYTKFVKLSYFGNFLCAILHKNHEVR